MIARMRVWGLRRISKNTLACWVLVFILVSLFMAGCSSPPDEKELPTVILIADGQQKSFKTQAKTVREFLAGIQVELGELDKLSPAEYTPISDGLEIKIVRVTQQIQTIKSPVAYETQWVREASVAAGEVIILEPGVNGVEELVFRVIYEDGVEVERHQIDTRLVQEPQPEIRLLGTQDVYSSVHITGTVAYLVGNEEVGFNAWLMRGSSGSQRRLTGDGLLDTRVFELSPGGRTLLFTRVASETDESGIFNTLWTLDTTLVDAEPREARVENVLWAGWAPDGQTIAYSTGEAGNGEQSWLARNDLWLGTLNERGWLIDRRKLVETSSGGTYGWWGTEFAWAPNERFIAYAQADEVGVISVPQGEQTELHRFAPYRTYSQWVWVPTLSWSPDSRFFTCVIHGPPVVDESPEDSPIFDVWVFSVDGELVVKMVNEAGMWASPSWSPGRRVDVGRWESLIAWGRAQNPYESVTAYYDVYVMDRDGSNRRRVFPQNPEDSQGVKHPEIAWGPTGTQLITVQRNDLFLVDLNLDVVRRLTNDGNIRLPRWTP